MCRVGVACLHFLEETLNAIETLAGLRHDFSPHEVVRAGVDVSAKQIPMFHISGWVGVFGHINRSDHGVPLSQIVNIRVDLRLGMAGEQAGGGQREARQTTGFHGTTP